MLSKGGKPQSQDSVSADEEVRGPLVLEFLGLKDEYSETDLEEALLRHPGREVSDCYIEQVQKN
jgi:predicted nuclease of restriction endonuclease-like (RecB) superfamily